MKTSLIIGVLASIFIVSCHSGKEQIEKVIYLKAYDRFMPDTIKRDLNVTLLQIYPAKRQCINGFEHYVKKQQDSVLFFVPKDFSIPAGAKYVITPLSFLVER